MDAAPKSALGDATNAPPPPAAKPPRPAADKPRRVVTWYHPTNLPPPTVASGSEEEEEEEEDLNAVQCSAAICFLGGWVTDADAALVCEACCAPNDTYHARCVCVDPAKMPADWDGKWLCPECEAEKKAKEDAAERADLKKGKDSVFGEEEVLTRRRTSSL